MLKKETNIEWEGIFKKMNEESFGKYNTMLVDKFTRLEDKMEDDRWIDLKNGETKKIKVKDAVVEIHDNIKEIKKTIQPLSDFTNLHLILKKYKLYWLLLVLLSGTALREIILFFIK